MSESLRQDLKTVRVIGAGAAGVVRLVMNKKTGAVALSRCRVRCDVLRVRDGNLRCVG